jgi:hypothetical protein
MATFEPALLEAMLAMLQRKGIQAVSVPAYRECSYNIGYCPTCSEIVTEVWIYYNLRSGSPRVWDFCGDLGELIRELTDAPTELATLEAGAVRETDDERWDRANCHSVSEALVRVP